MVLCSGSVWLCLHSQTATQSHLLVWVTAIFPTYCVQKYNTYCSCLSFPQLHPLRLELLRCPATCVGDFRAHVSMFDYPSLRTLPSLKTLYLDTTYCDPQYSFPQQEEVVSFIVNRVAAGKKTNKRLLVVCGTYTIGKERIFLGMLQDAVDTCCAVSGRMYNGSLYCRHQCEYYTYIRMYIISCTYMTSMGYVRIYCRYSRFVHPLSDLCTVALFHSHVGLR